jgi:hypothetical protein
MPDGEDEIDGGEDDGKGQGWVIGVRVDLVWGRSIAPSVVERGHVFSRCAAQGFPGQLMNPG